MPQKKVTYVSLLADESIHESYEKALAAVKKKLGQHHPMFIGDSGLFTKEEFEVRSPIDSGILIGYFQKANGEDARRAVAHAKSAFLSWSLTDWKERVRIIRTAADTLSRQMFTLAALITYEVGKNRYEAVAEVSEAIDFLRYYADLYEAHGGFITPMVSEIPGESCVSVLRPHGVWAVISPFNFPIALAAGMAGAALIAGNTVVLKPTSLAPLSGLKLYQAFISSGIPPGVVNAVTGPGEAFGDVVTAHPDVDGIAFTGSRDVGIWLARRFAAKQPYAKPVVSELGSKNPCIVTDNADIEKAVEGIVRAAFGYGGQKCSATSRVYVQEGIAGRFTEALAKRVSGLVVGDPRAKDAFIGPVINQQALDRFTAAVREAREMGGTILTGGEELTKKPFMNGFYATPTLVTGIPRDHRLFKDELFVPFVVVDTFSTLQEALSFANDTEYGLTAGIFSEEQDETDYFFEHIRFGVCYANRSGGATTGAWPGAQPFGGWKASGATGKGAGGPWYLLSYLREQAQTRVTGEKGPKA
ncbi:MAG: aldehyde dehydrogenase family protein [Methanomicrobiales archaeon]|nr:aldehyde dehydrogenase family protein [Methanomicrobiales archaeon]